MNIVKAVNLYQSHNDVLQNHVQYLTVHQFTHSDNISVPAHATKIHRSREFWHFIIIYGIIRDLP